MGLNREVRDFFTMKINRVLNKRVDEIKETMDMGKISEKSMSEFSKNHAVGNIPAEWNKMEELEEELKTVKAELEHQISGILYGIKGRNYSRYSNNTLGALQGEADRIYGKDVKSKMYPKEVKKLALIDTIKEDVRGAVLLSTTEPKLVRALTKLLENYGGEIKELIKLIPTIE